jgi:non-reducing end alpha-L-arabinofuranosidase
MTSSRIFNRLVTALAVVIISVSLTPLHSPAADCPCDIYKAAGTPCVAAYSTVRLLSSTHTGSLYQVRRSSDQQTKDIPALSDGVANASVQDSFLGSGAGTISKIYDQSGKGNDLTVAKKGNYSGTAGQNDKESNAKAKSLMINGHKAYALYTNPQEGYRSNQENYTGYPNKANAANGLPTKSEAQGIYAVEDGSRASVGDACCFDFGNASLDNSADGTGSMNSLFFGVCTYWGTGTGNGPWFLNDMEAGVWGGGSGDSKVKNNNLPSSKFDFAFGLTKTNTSGTSQYAIRVANGTVGGKTPPSLVTAYNGQAPSTWKLLGSVILGIGGDNSNSSNGTFYEGCITAGRPSDSTDNAILKNVVNANYGSTTVTPVIDEANDATPAPGFMVRYNQSSASAVVDYTLAGAGHVNVVIVDPKGKQVAEIVDGIFTAGRHQAAWDAKGAAQGVYVCKVLIDGREGLARKIVIGQKAPR